MNLDDLIAAEQYSLTQVEKERHLTTLMRQLVAHHRRACPPYDRVLRSIGCPERFDSLAEVPYLPVGLFKSHLLSSVPDDEVFKTMSSSGTTGQQVSRIVLDRLTAQRQSQALTSIMTHVLGPRRLPMIVVDTPNVVKDRTSFSARGAGVLGMLSYGRQHLYALGDDMNLDHDRLAEFLRRFSGEPILIFGFTFMVWQHFLRQLDPGEADLSNAILVHSGGWKKLVDEQVDNPTFKEPSGSAPASPASTTSTGWSNRWAACSWRAGRLPPPAELRRRRHPRPGDVGARAGRRGRGDPGAERTSEQLPGSLDPDRGPRRRARQRGTVLDEVGWQAAGGHRAGTQGRAARLQRHPRCRPDRPDPRVTHASDPIVVDLTDSPELAEEILARVASTRAIEPFADDVVSFCHDFSRRLARAGRGVPELVALAFWMRRAELVRLREEFERLATTETLLVPRGTVLHIPPANVDTIFIYSWLVSLLVGNKNVVRLSRRRTPTVNLILDVLAETFAEGAHARVRSGSAFVRYGHERTMTTRLSAACDVRVIWGGDVTVETVRTAPLPPHAVELTFPDRLSMAALRTEAYLALGHADRDRVAESFYNDAYWFDQMGCSSPRVVYWVGSEHASREASADFYPRVRSVVSRRRYAVDTAIGLRKMTFAYQAAADLPVTRLHAFGNELQVLELAAPVSEHGTLHSDFPGAGTFFDRALDQLTDVASYVQRRDQTLSHFGFTAAELHSLARAANGRGIDRMVPFGQALTFNRYWDGHDLLQSFSRRVFIRTAAGELGGHG